VIGIVIPSKREANSFVNLIKNLSKETIFGFSFYNGIIEGIKCSLVICGIGKVNAAAATAYLISTKRPRYLFHFGSAGALSSDLLIGDLLLYTKVIEHDFYSSFSIPQVFPELIVQGKLFDNFLEYVEENDILIKKVKAASGDEDVYSHKRKKELLITHQADVVDWESFSFLHVCKISKMDCLIIRAVSDLSENNTKNEFFGNIDKSIGRICEIFIKFLKKAIIVK